MNKLTATIIYALLLSSPLAAAAQTPRNTIEASAMYTSLHANAPVGGCGCFWMNGGTGEIAVPIWRNFSLEAQVNGEHADHIPNFNVGLSLLTGLGGIRMRMPTHTIFQPYAHALFGGVHGFDGYFPSRADRLPTSYDTSFAMAFGGGIDLRVSRHIWIRAIEADYHYSELSNLQGDRQNQYRLGAGIVFRGSGK